MSLAPQVLAALSAAASPDQAQRQGGEQQLQQLKANGSAFLGACTEIFVSAECPMVGRQLAGLQLKNAITAVMNAPNGQHPMTGFFVNNAQLQLAICGQALQDSQRSVRNVAASIVSWAVYANLWEPEQTLSALVGDVMSRKPSVAAVHGAMRALSQIVSDCVLLLEARSLIGPIVQGVLPFLTAADFFSADFANPQNPPAVKEANRDAMDIRNGALDVIITVLDRSAGDSKSVTFQSVQPFVPQLTEAMLFNVQGLEANYVLHFSFATKACQCLVGLLAFHESISNEMFMPVLHCLYQITSSTTTGEAANAAVAQGYISENEREKLGIEATGFWSTILNVPRFVEQVRPALENLIYYLIRQMKYSDFEMGMLAASSNDWNEPDKIDDVKPRHYEAKTQSTSRKANKQEQQQQHHHQQQSEHGAAMMVNSTNRPNDDDDDDDDDDEDDEVQEWNLRRVSSATLDELAECFGEDVIKPVLKCIEGMMQPGQPWKELEAAVLAFGAICDGCFDSLGPYLPTVAARFVQILESADSHFLVVNTTLWTATQIGRYFVDGEGAESRRAFQHVTRLILGKMQSPSKLTQESAAEALESMVQLCGEWGDDAVARLDPLAAEILNTIATCMGGYQLKNKVLLFEVLQSVCEVMGQMFQANPDAATVILTPLGELWGVIPNDNPLIFSYFSCMGTVCGALGATMQPMAEQIFTRASDLMAYHIRLREAAYQRLGAQQTTQQMQKHQGAQSIALFDDVPDEDFLVTAASLLSGLFDALGSSLEPLVAARQPAFVQMLLFTLTDRESTAIRQSGFALLGDLAKSCSGHVQAALPQIVPCVMQNLAEHQQREASAAAQPDDDEDGYAESMYPVLSNITWFLCNLVENQMEVNNLPTLATVAPETTPQLFHGLASVLCSKSELPREAANMAENIVLCLGLLLYSDAELEARSQVPVSAFAKPFLTYMLNIKEDLAHRTPALQGFLLCVQNSPHGPQAVAGNLTQFFDMAVKMKHDSPDLIRAMKQLLQAAKQSNGQVWARRIAAYPRAMTTQLFQIYGLN